MDRVLEECENVSADFSPDPVHDLRVSLRRCRSVADGMIAMDPDKDWKAMKKAGKALFQRLGALRDVQIMLEWIDKLDLASLTQAKESGTQPDQASERPAASLADVGAAQTQPLLAMAADGTNLHPLPALVQILREREGEHKREARAALEEFDRKQWKQWSKTLPPRATRIRPGSAVFKHLALERWTTARELHVRAFRNRSQVALHALRIGIKRFRYIVENFLPTEHKAWSKDLKRMQDLLGDVHDLDVLWTTATSCRIFPDEALRKAWHDRILEERERRVEEYRLKTTGSDSRWNVWRAGLPQGSQIQEFATRRMKLWAKVLDPDFAHSERVARLALELYDGLTSAGLFPGKPSTFSRSSSPPSKTGLTDARASLYLAALLHDVGKGKGSKGHHKRSEELIRKHGTPLGWKAEDMALAALLARFHSGALPTRSHKSLRELLPEQQKEIIRLSAVLRLANALDAAHDGHVRRVKIENADSSKRRTSGFLRKPAPLAKAEALVIAAEGYVDGTSTARAVAAERYLLETVLRRPVLVKPAPVSRRSPAGRRQLR